MDKINFNNLPSTDSALSAENMNAMQDNIEKSVVYIGSTQPSSNEKVWLKQGKNLINYDKLLWGYSVLDTGAIQKETVYSSYWATTPFVLIVPNATYIFSHALGTANGRVCFYDGNRRFINSIEETITTAFTTPSNAKYVVIGIWSNATNTTTETWVQLEQNATATTHEDYIEKEILIKNSNNVFEQFYYENKGTTYSYEE